MALLSVEELKTLIAQTANPHVSIYMPIQRTGIDIKQNPIRFKNLIRQVEDKLEAMDIRYDDAIAWLQPVLNLDAVEFWENQNAGLAIFATPEMFRYYSLPQQVEEAAIVGDRFHLKPLLPLLADECKFYVLALSQKDIRLLECTRYSVQEIELEGVPKSADEALLYDETAKEGQHRIATSKGGTANSFVQPGSFHGQGSPDRDRPKQDILQFFHIVNNGVAEKLKNQTAPLVLAGVEYLLPIYKEASSYQHIVETGITGNPQGLKPEELQAAAWEIVEPLFDRAQTAAIQHYRELAGTSTGKASDDIKEIVPSAYFQRVDSLFVAADGQQWGRFEPDTNTVEVHPEAQPEDEDLLELAALHTVLNGGKVYAVGVEGAADKAPVAAIFRY